MCNDKRESAVLEEQRLDTLLQLAFEYDAMEETRQILSECTGELSPKDEAICRRAYASFLRKLARLERRERRTIPCGLRPEPGKSLSAWWCC